MMLIHSLGCCHTLKSWAIYIICIEYLGCKEVMKSSWAWLRKMGSVFGSCIWPIYPNRHVWLAKTLSPWWFHRGDDLSPLIIWVHVRYMCTLQSISVYIYNIGSLGLPINMGSPGPTCRFHRASSLGQSDMVQIRRIPLPWRKMLDPPSPSGSNQAPSLPPSRRPCSV